ncbi:MAG: winged helix-turn-helix transcriptional regulator [Firmicutes bacterium]|nr:winged helix-turn-helix transcriptional regulator [Bacillota bacterium]
MNSLVDFFKAMGEETRVKILMMLFEEEMCICELIEELQLSQSAVSHHVKILKQAGLVNDRRDGKWTFCSINQAGFKTQLDVLQDKIVKLVDEYEYQIKAEPKSRTEN